MQMPESRRSVVVNVPPDKFYAVISDYESYSKFIPEMRSVRVLKTTGNIQQVAFEIELQVMGFTKKVHYTLEFTNSPPDHVRWRLLESNLIKSNNGGWTLKPTGDGQKTDALYQIELKLGALVPGAVSTFLAEQSLPKLLEQFKKRAESLKG
jgi:ribosome-associated toxin RatA of RatAB toxin-antitoxin module